MAMTLTDRELHWEDVVGVVAYLSLVVAVGIWASCRSNQKTSQGYFLAGNTMNWFLIGASTFATNIGAPMFIGLVGAAAASGVVVVMFEWQAMLMLVMLGWLFLPVYMASGVYTMPQYLKKRYGGERIRMIYAAMQMLIIIISLIAGQVYAGAIFIQQIFGWNIYLAVGIVLIVSTIYTIIGGLTAVMYTDALQALVLVAGSMTLAVLSLVEVGGYAGLLAKYPLAGTEQIVTAHARANVSVTVALANVSVTSGVNMTLDGDDVGSYNINSTCASVPRADAFHILRAPDADFPWPGMVFGLFVMALNIWCTDQTTVQRSLAAKSYSHAKGGILFAAFLKILPFPLFVLPGMVSRVLYPHEVACGNPDVCRAVCQNPYGCSNIAYPLLVLRLLPVGVRGLMLAAVLAALMSSLSSVFNSAATIFAIDMWSRLRRQTSERQLMLVTRLFIVFLALVGFAWIPVLEAMQGSLFFNYSQQIAAYVLPPLAVCFVCGIFWTRTTEQGAFWGMVVGLLVGFIRVVLHWAYTMPVCGQPDPRPAILADVHFMYFAIISTTCSAIVTVLVSLFTEPRSPEQLKRVTWWTRFETSADETKAETGNVEMENQGLEHKPIADANRTASEYSIAPKMEVDNSNNWIKSNDSEVKLVVNGMKKEAADIPHVHKERVEDTVGDEQLNWKQRVLSHCCGYSFKAPQDQRLQGLLQRDYHKYMKESKLVKWSLNACAVACVVVCVTLHACFA